MMRRKRSCSTHQTSIVNVHAVVLGLDGVGKSGEFIKELTQIIDNYGESFRNSSLNHSLLRFELKGRYQRKTIVVSIPFGGRIPSG